MRKFKDDAEEKAYREAELRRAANADKVNRANRGEPEEKPSVNASKKSKRKVKESFYERVASLVEQDSETKKQIDKGARGDDDTEDWAKKLSSPQKGAETPVERAKRLKKEKGSVNASKKKINGMKEDTTVPIELNLGFDDFLDSSYKSNLTDLLDEMAMNASKKGKKKKKKIDDEDTDQIERDEADRQEKADAAEDEEEAKTRQAIEANTAGADAEPDKDSDRAKKLAKAGQKHPATTDTGWRDKLTGKPTYAPKGTSAFASDKVNASKKKKLKAVKELKSKKKVNTKESRATSKPMNRPTRSGTTDWETRKTTPLKPDSPLHQKGALDKHNKAMDDVERRRAARADKKKVVDTLKQDARSDYGQAGKAQGKQKSTGDTSKKPSVNASNKNEAKKDKDWIQKAVNPDHEGYCTPMTKSTCTPKRKALAKTFKKMGRKRDRETKAKDEK